MHEAGIAHRVIDICSATLRAHGGARATVVGLRVGALSSVDPDALTFCFDALKADTPLASATLHIEWRSRFGCACQNYEGRDHQHNLMADACPVCGAAESLADACALDIRHLEFDLDPAS